MANFPKFNEDRFKEWNKSFHEVIEVYTLRILLKFPKKVGIDSKKFNRKNQAGEVPFLDDNQIGAIPKLIV